MEEKEVEVQNATIEGNKKPAYIDMQLVWNRIKQNKRKFMITLPIVFVVSCLYTLCLPRYYNTSVSLVPEMGSQGDMGGTLGSLASSFGLELGNMESTDAISPLLYPDLMSDNAFVANLYDIHVQSSFDPEMPIDTTYFAYLKHYQKSPFWEKAINHLKKMMASDKDTISQSGKYDPYYVSKEEDGIMNKIRDNVVIDLDKKTGVISISVEAQDPIICRTIADSLTTSMQTFIIDYRTRKARVDADHYKQLMDNAKAEYDSISAEYARFCDTHMNVILQTVNSERDNLENEMQMRLTNYTTMQTQYQAALARVQERTPAFTLLKGANVPVKHAGPKRMLIVIGMCFFAALILLIYSLKDEILR